MKIYTRTGDTGETGLLDGRRVPKHSLRVAAYGDVDELNAVLGLVRATSPVLAEDALLELVQRDLFAIGTQLATADHERVADSMSKVTLDEGRIATLESAIDAADAQLDALKTFVLPAGTPKAATLHVARTVCRRAERSVVGLADSEEVPPLVITYLNRLSDLLFTFARLANAREAQPDAFW